MASVKTSERPLSVVTMRAASQNGDLATVLVGSAAPTVSGLAINVLQHHRVVLFPLDHFSICRTLFDGTIFLMFSHSKNAHFALALIQPL